MADDQIGATASQSPVGTESGLPSLFAVAPWPWTLFPALSHADPAFIRDVNGKTVARAIPHADVAAALVAFVNGLEVPPEGLPETYPPATLSPPASDSDAA